MNPDIFALTLRQLLARKALICLGLALLPVLVAAVIRLGGGELEAERWAAKTLFEGLIVTAVLPLTALLLGVSVLGDELEDSTAVYILAKPLPRWQILLPKLTVAALLTSGLVLLSVVGAGLIALYGRGGGLLAGFAVGTVCGALAYSALFVLLSLVTSRALIAGMVYVFIWETTITALFEGTRYLSIRHYVLGISDWLSGTPAAVYDAYVSGALALGLLALVTVASFLAAERRLAETEVRETA